MTIGDRLDGLRLPLLRGRTNDEGQERLLKLYWNRAEIKKELAALDDQLYELRDRLKQQAALTDRVRAERDALEALLGNPDLGLGALVHFQLRAVWKACRDQLEHFAAELRRQQEERERKRQVAEFHHDRQARITLAEERLAEANAALGAEQAALDALGAELAALTGFWHYFRRRRLNDQSLAAAERRDRARQYLADMKDARRTVDKEPWPEFGGIALEGRRAINVAVIAYAQLLYVRLAPTGLALQARAAARKSVHEANYGGAADCNRLMTEIALALATIRAQRDLAQEIRTRSEGLRAQVSYAHAREAVPEAASLPSAFGAGREGVSLREANVLTEDFWDLSQVLLN
jgi:hypothetical protein